MRTIEAVMYLAILHIAGDNIAIVPDITLARGSNIYLEIILAYLVFGSMITGVLAWIGMITGQELNRVAGILFGCKGKHRLALITLIVCIPASALTGGYFSGVLIHTVSGLSIYWAVTLSLVIYSLLAAGIGNDLLKISNYIAFLLIPLVILLFWVNEYSLQPIAYSVDQTDWVLIFALAGYNIGGMRSLLVVETSAYLLHKGYKTIWMSIGAKVSEGIFTLGLSYLILSTGTQGPFALLRAGINQFSSSTAIVFAVVLFCVFINTMAPAMMVNAKQISILTKLSFVTSLCIATAIVWLLSFIYYYNLLVIISIGTIALMIFLIFTAYRLHKHREIK